MEKKSTNKNGFPKWTLGPVDRPSLTYGSECDGSIVLLDGVDHSEVADSQRPKSFQLPSQILS